MSQMNYSLDPLSLSADEDWSVLSVSTTFFPGAEIPTAPFHPPDVILHSHSNSVLFYVHREMLLRHSNNWFGAYLYDPSESIVDLPVVPPSPDSESSCESTWYDALTDSPISPLQQQQCSTQQNLNDRPTLVALFESSDVINVLLHVLYDIPCDRYSPSLDTLTAIFPALAQYGIPALSVITPSSEITRLFLVHAVSSPLEVYSIAAQASLDHLAVSASRFSLAASLADLNEDMCAMMGPTYLRRLLFLHLGRVEALKRLLLVQPAMHAPTPLCGDQDQRKTLRAWALATAYLAWEARVDLPNMTINASFLPLIDQIECYTCKNNLQQQVTSILSNWEQIKSTI